MESAPPAVPPPVCVHKTTLFLAVSINHAELLADVLVPEALLPKSGTYGKVPLVVVCACADPIAIGNAKLAAKRVNNFISVSLLLKSISLT